MQSDMEMGSQVEFCNPSSAMHSTEPVTEKKIKKNACKDSRRSWLIRYLGDC